MEKAESCDDNALNGWDDIYGREVTADEMMEIDTNIQKLADVLIEIEGSKRNG